MATVDRTPLRRGRSCIASPSRPTSSSTLMRRPTAISRWPITTGRSKSCHPGSGSMKSPRGGFASIVTSIADRLGLPLRRHGQLRPSAAAGDGPYKGKGKEPDESFYFANARTRLPSDRDLDLDAGDPPPDLWIEVDNRVSSAGRLPVYAALGVPEVWRYRARKKTLRFLRLVDDTYEPIEQSLALPVLTPALVLEALALGDGLWESEWVRTFSARLGRPDDPFGRSPSRDRFFFWRRTKSCPPSKATSPRPPADSRSSRPGSIR